MFNSILPKKDFNMDYTRLKHFNMSWSKYIKIVKVNYIFTQFIREPLNYFKKFSVILICFIADFPRYFE